MSTHQERVTRKLELVETHNIALSLTRLRNGIPHYDTDRWKRALLHAVQMTGNRGEQEKIRIALELP